MASVESADQVTGDQGVFHAHMAHGDAVAHGDGGELDGGAAGGADAGLDGLGDLVQVHVAGDDLVVGADHADQGALQLLLGVAQGIEQAAVRCPFGAFFDVIAVHFFSPFIQKAFPAGGKALFC